MFSTVSWLRALSHAVCLLLSLLPAAASAQPALLDMPMRLAIDAQSNVFVIESNVRRIAKFDAGGMLVVRFGESGTAPGQFQSVQDIAVDAAGNVLVLDRIGKSVLRFTNAGVFINAWSLFPTTTNIRPHSIVVDAAGRLFVSIGNSGSIYTFSATGQFVSQTTVVDERQGDETPGDLALDAAGNLYAVDKANHRILKFGTGGPANDPLLWVGSIGGCTTGPLCQVVPGNVGAPSRTTGWCDDFARCGEPRSGRGLGRFEAPIYLSVSASGELNVSDMGSGVIQRFNAAGAYIGDLAVRGRMPGQTNADATAVGPNGDVYTVQPRIGRVSRFTAAGVFVGVFGGGVELSVFPGDTALNRLSFTIPDTKTSTIGVISIGGYSGPLSLKSTHCLSASGPPARPCSSIGITPSFSNPNLTVTAGAAATTLQIAVSSSAPDGLSLIIVDSATPGLPAFAQVGIDVKLQRAVSVAPSSSAVTLMPGDPKLSVPVEVKSVNLSGSVSLAGAFVPPPASNHMSHDFKPNGSFTLSPNGSVSRTVDITALPAARTGNFTLNVTASAPNGVKVTSPIAVKVECFCSDTGDFVLPAVLPVSTVAGNTGTSPDGRFTVTATSTGLSASVRINSQANPSQLLVSPVANASAWGFSPNSRYFLVASAGPSSHITEIAIFDLNFANRRVVSEQVSGCPVGQIGCTPPPSFCYAGPGSAANNACTGGGGATKASSFNVGTAAWGFGPDSKSFMIADVNPLVSSSMYTLRLYNLAAGTPTAPVILSTGAQAISSFWRYSPCGDLFMHFNQAFPMPSSNDTASFHRTSGTYSSTPFQRASLIVAAGGTVASGPVGARVETAFVSNGDFDVRLLNLSRSAGSPATGFASPQCQRR